MVFAHPASNSDHLSITRPGRLPFRIALNDQVLAAPASSGTIILILPWNIDPKSFQKSKIFSFSRGLRKIGPEIFMTAQRKVALKPPPSKKHKHIANAARALRPL